MTTDPLDGMTQGDAAGIIKRELSERFEGAPNNAETRQAIREKVYDFLEKQLSAHGREPVFSVTAEKDGVFIVKGTYRPPPVPRFVYTLDPETSALCLQAFLSTVMAMVGCVPSDLT